MIGPANADFTVDHGKHMLGKPRKNRIKTQANQLISPTTWRRVRAG
jgi:hypothetical protein